MFEGSGQVRALARRLDWSATPLGPVESWSPVLRTMVITCLSSAFAISIYWGPRRAAIYNDAFAALIGDKHPAALGRPASVAQPDIWERESADFDRVTDSGETVTGRDEQRILHRYGYPEECYFTFSHSPIVDVDGSTAGILTLWAETTAAVLYQRRMRVVRELAELSIADAGNTAETCRAALRVLATARETIPFAIVFLAEDGTARRVADYGLSPGASIPGLTDAGAANGAEPGPVAKVLATGQTVEITGLRDRFPHALLPGPLGPSEPDAGIALPLWVTGRTDPIGVLVLAVNPYRPLGPEYRSYARLICRQLGVALTDTLAIEVERLRVQVLADLDRAKMEFFQNVSHELRTPLTLLRAPLQDLLDRAGDRSTAERQDLRAAVRASERLHEMVDALLDFSGAEVGTLKPDRQPTDLAGLTADLASMFRSAAHHAGLAFLVDVPQTPVVARVDRAMWSTIVTNLLANAVKYTHRGRIETALRETGSTVTLTVTDTGTGIEPAHQARIFERFYRADDHSLGAGIGLAVVTDLVRAHQGDIALSSTPGAGSTFTVTVPIADEVAIDDTRSDRGASVTDAADSVSSGSGTESDRPTEGGTTNRPRILLVEDDTDLRDYLDRLLTRDGWDVLAVADAETALSLSDGQGAGGAGLVITDVMLPGRDGLSLVGVLRQNPATARLPVLVLTARHGTQATTEGLAAGADDYITKPFEPQELLARVRANYELAQSRESAVDQAVSRAGQFREAMDSNRVIGTAVGIMMTFHRLTATQAFELLVAASQHTNRKLRDLAADVVAGGRMPLRQTLIDELLRRVGSTGRPATPSPAG